MRYFHIDPEKIFKNRAVINGSDAKHIKNVLRMKPGDGIRLLDGAGYEYAAVISEVQTGRITVELLKRIEAQTDSPLQFTLAQGMLKEKKIDALIRPLTELGVSRLELFVASRSVATPDARRISQRMERWEKIAMESLKQCRRSTPMEITPLKSFQDMLESARDFDRRLIFWEEAPDRREQPSVFVDSDCESIFAAIGPEGGFTEEEVQSARSHGFEVCGMGPRILRAETAAIAAAALIQHRFGDMKP